MNGIDSVGGISMDDGRIRDSLTRNPHFSRLRIKCSRIAVTT